MQPKESSSLMTRRDALRKTILFSSGLLAGSYLSRAQPPASKFSSKGLNFLAMGDFGTGNVHQRAVAHQMSVFAKKLDAPLDAVLALGDNFYKELKPDRFKNHFEDMYPKSDFDCPFYACLGNHDYGPLYDSNQGAIKAQMQVDYAKNNPASRWKLPSKWYALELPNPEKPLVKIIILDGNFAAGAMTPQEKLDQKRFLDAEVEKKTKAPWLWMITHFPMFSQTTKRGDNSKLELWLGNYLKSHPFDLYLSGHDHNLQHLRMPGYKNNFVVSGAGGASLYEVEQSNRGFTKKILGFNHLHVSEEEMTVQFIDETGNCLHAFRRDRKGKTKILQNS